MEGSFYPGPLPIGIVAGIVLVIQIALLILCIRNILTFRFHWIIALTMLMSGFSILNTGFFFIGWVLFFSLKIQFVEKNYIDLKLVRDQNKWIKKKRESCI